MAHHYSFTSESVSAGHPDKMADQISDAIVDAVLTDDYKARIACEVLITTGMVIVAGEISSSAQIMIPDIVRQTIEKIGYTNSDLGFDAKTCSVLVSLDKQSEDIAIGVNEETDHPQGAGDQGLMFGFACNETETLMPAPIEYAHRLTRRQAELREDKTLPWLRPDAKSQVSFRYQDDRPVSIDTVVLSTQHDPDITQTELQAAVLKEIIKPVLKGWLNDDTRFHINPTGRFVIGGPMADCGLTGRKIIVDTYGGMARHGGGAFSGKDPTKVDRSAAYAARYVAKNIVAADLADRCEVQLSYAIGIAEPTSIYVNTFGTGKLTNDELVGCIKEHFDLTPKGIISMLDLQRPIYADTATYGHFGRSHFPWEKTDKLQQLKA